MYQIAKKRSTIFINYLEKKYRALIVEMRNDNSIYIYYPNKNGYFVSHKQEIQFSNTKFQETFSFGVNNSNEIYNPYISYHPGKGVVHANAKDKDESIVPLIKDRDTSTLEDLIKRPEFVPVCSVLFSTNITNFEEAVPTKEDYVLELSKKYKFSDQDDALYIEVFAMSKASYHVYSERLSFHTSSPNTLTSVRIELFFTASTIDATIHCTIPVSSSDILPISFLRNDSTAVFGLYRVIRSNNVLSVFALLYLPFSKRLCPIKTAPAKRAITTAQATIISTRVKPCFLEEEKTTVFCFTVDNIFCTSLSSANYSIILEDFKQKLSFPIPRKRRLKDI